MGKIMKYLHYMAYAALLNIFFTFTLPAQASEVTQSKPVPTKPAFNPAIKKPYAVTSTTGSKKLPPEAFIKGQFKGYKCPAELKFPAEDAFTNNRVSVKFKSATVSSGICLNDISTDQDKRGYCMTCSYEANIRLNRSSGKNYKCQVTGANKDEFTCENVSVLTPAQSCRFNVTPPIVNAMPYTHHSNGDKDLHTGGIYGDEARITVNANIIRGTGPQTSNALFIKISVGHKELAGGPKYTKFSLIKAFKLKDQNYVNATAQDVANCLASYPRERPLVIVPENYKFGGRVSTKGKGHDWKTISGKGLIQKLECKYDSKYSDDMKRAGCRKIWFKPFTIVLK